MGLSKLKGVMAFALLMTASHMSLASEASCNDLFLKVAQPTRATLNELLNFDGQKLLEKDFANGGLRSADDLIYSYSSERDLTQYVQLSANLRSKLSEPQTEALNSYTSKDGSYVAINELMNKTFPHTKSITLKRGRARVSELIPPMAKEFDSIFESAPLLPKGLFLFRGITSNEPITIPAKGKTLKYSQFLSTSLDPETAHHFADFKRRDHRVIFVIRIEGNEIPAVFVGNTKETEVILPRSVEFRVDSTKTSFDRESNATYKIIHLSAIAQRFEKK